MSESVIVTVLAENSVRGRGLIAEHGLALHIQAGSHSLLFDTGQSDLMLHNALKLCINLAEAEAVVLSHGHYDHTGGLKAVRQTAPQARTFLHPAALSPKFAHNADSTTRFIGMNQNAIQAVLREPETVVWTNKATEVTAAIFVTGEIPRQTNFEDTGGPFFHDADCVTPDSLLDDQALFFDTLEGLVVVLGCAHSGVINTLRYVRHLAGDRPIHALLGGLHLLDASPERLTRTVAALRELNVQRLGLAHCTGPAASARLWSEFPQACAACQVGARFVFQRLESTTRKPRV